MLALEIHMILLKKKYKVFANADSLSQLKHSESVQG